MENCKTCGQELPKVPVTDRFSLLHELMLNKYGQKCDWPFEPAFSLTKEELFEMYQSLPYATGPFDYYCGIRIVVED